MVAHGSPWPVHRAVVHHGHSERRGDAEVGGGAFSGLPVDLIEKHVLRVPHDLVVGCGAQGFF